MIDLAQFIPGILLIIGFIVGSLVYSRIRNWYRSTSKVGFGFTNLTRLYGIYERSDRVDLEGFMLYLGPFGLGVVRARKKKK